MQLKALGCHVSFTANRRPCRLSRYIRHMPKHPQFTPTTWQEQKRLLAEGQHTSDLGTSLLLIAFGAAFLGFIGMLVYLLWGVLR